MASITLAALATPASAVDPDVKITSLSSTDIKAGQSATLEFTVENKNPGNGGASANIRVRFQNLNGLACEGNPCSTIQTIPPLGPGEQPQKFQVTLKAQANIPAGETRTGKVRVTADFGDGDETTVEADMIVRGPDAAPTTQPTQGPASVPEVSGKVTDIFTAKPIKGATVFLQDNAGTTHTTGTDEQGRFTFTSTPQKPIVAGPISISVEKDGFKGPQPRAILANAGQAVRNVALGLEPLTTAATGTPPTEVGSLPPVTVESDPGSTLGASNASGSGDEGGVSWLVIAIGGLLVALGLGAIVLLLVKRKGDDDEEAVPARSGPGTRPGAPGPGGRPPARRPGAPDPTSVMRRPDGPGPRGGDATMIARSPLADAPTMLHSRVPDNTDPYGPGGRPAPPPPARPTQAMPPAGPGGYGPPPTGGGYGPGPASGYGQQAGGGYGSPADPGGYGAYGSPAGSGAYGSPAGGGAYGSPAAPSGYGPRSGYEPTHGDPQYGGQDPRRDGGYGQPSGYDQGSRYETYDQGGHSGYGQPGGPEQRGPRPGPGGQPPSDRRPLDWMED